MRYFLQFVTVAFYYAVLYNIFYCSYIIDAIYHGKLPLSCKKNFCCKFHLLLLYSYCYSGFSPKIQFLFHSFQCHLGWCWIIYIMPVHIHQNKEFLLQITERWWINNMLVSFKHKCTKICLVIREWCISLIEHYNYFSFTFW